MQAWYDAAQMRARASEIAVQRQQTGWTLVIGRARRADPGGLGSRIPIPQPPLEAVDLDARQANRLAPRKRRRLGAPGLRCRLPPGWRRFSAGHGGSAGNPARACKPDPSQWKLYRIVNKPDKPSARPALGGASQWTELLRPICRESQDNLEVSAHWVTISDEFERVTASFH